MAVDEDGRQFDARALSAERRVVELERRCQRLERDLAVARWREQALRVRRSRRALAAIENANGLLDWLLVPLRVLKALFTSRAAPPRPRFGDLDTRETELRTRIEVASDAFDAGDDAPVEALARDLGPASVEDPVAFGFLRQAYLRAGSLDEHLRLVRGRLAVAPDNQLRAAERKELGRHRELDRRWLPSIPGSSTYAPVSGRVLHVIKESSPYLTNGYTMRSGYTVRSQLEAGLDPVVVTSLGFPRTVLDEVGEDDLATAEVMGVRHHRLDLGPSYDYARTPWDQAVEDAAVAAAPVVEAERPELVQAGSGFRGVDTALLGLAIARRYDLPFVYEVRSFLEHTWTGDLQRSERGQHFQMRSDREVQLMLEADHVITIAESMREDLVARGVPRDHVSVVPNGVDTAAFQSVTPPAHLMGQLGLEPGVPIVGYVSNLGRREGIEVLADAVVRLRATGTRVQGLVVGEGPVREDVEQLLAEAGDTSAVCLPGRVPHAEIQNYYCLMDVFVIPRLDDRAARLVTPLKPFEAMALARPMVVSDLPALEEIVAPPRRGLTFRTGDAASLAEQLRSLLVDEPRRRELGAAARRWVEEERDWSMNGPRYRAVYEQVLRARRKVA